MTTEQIKQLPTPLTDAALIQSNTPGLTLVDCDFARSIEQQLEAMKRVAIKASEFLKENTIKWLNRECNCDPKRLGTRCHRCHCMNINQEAVVSINSTIAAIEGMK